MLLRETDLKVTLIFKVQNIIIEHIISLMVIWFFLGQLDYLLNFNELGNSILVA